ncbi:hypothetical protein [Petrachloros mirabilis]
MVPELASREHLRHIVPVVREARSPLARISSRSHPRTAAGRNAGSTFVGK